MENKKIINATPTIEGGVAFDSKLESKLFRVLVEEGLNPQREPHEFHIWNGFKPTVPFYKRNRKTKAMELNSIKLIDITYTPDISFEYGKHIVYVEVKPDGFTNDVYPYKEKMFRKYMETKLIDKNPIFVRVGSIKSLKEFINILRTEYNEES